MNVYIVTFCIFLLFMIVDEHVFVSNNRVVFRQDRNQNYSSKFLLMMEALWLIAITGLRHSSLSADYYNYKYSYIASKSATIIDSLNAREPIYHLFSKIVGMFSNYDIVVLMVAMAIVTVIPIIIYFRKEIPGDVLFAVFVLITLGSYYTSFNTTRQYMCIGLFSLALVYANNRKFVRYVIAVLLISFIHLSALILIPFYWLLYIKWNTRKNLIINIAVILAFGVVFLILPRYAISLSSLYYQGASNINAVELFDKTQEELSIFVIMRPLLFFVIAVINNRLIDQNNRRELCLFNCSFYFLLFTAYAYQITMFRRFSYFFIPGAIACVITILNKDRCRYYTLCKIVIILFALAWSIYGQFSNEYLFFWE